MWMETSKLRLILPPQRGPKKSDQIQSISVSNRTLELLTFGLGSKTIKIWKLHNDIPWYSTLERNIQWSLNHKLIAK